MDGRAVATELKQELIERVRALAKRGVKPHLAILKVNPDERTEKYVRAKSELGRAIGVRVSVYEFETSTRPQTLYDQIHKTLVDLNQDQLVHGIILQLPLSADLDTDQLLNTIKPEKDVDGLTATNEAALETGRELFPPATPLGILRLLAYYKVPISGKKFTIIGQGRLVGRPLAWMLASRGAQVQTGDRTTRDLTKLTQDADVIVSAAGTANLITADMIKPNTVLIDVGLAKQDATLVGDIDEAAKAKSRLATPVPGGVGPMTVVSLLSNVILAAEYQQLKLSQ